MPARAFRIGWVAGMSFSLATLYWVELPIARFTRMSAVLAVGPLLLLCAVLSLYSGAFSAALRAWQRRTGREGIVFAPVLWVALEWLRSSFLLPFPWNLLGYTQYRSENLLQMTEITGIYGLSALVVAVNAVIHAVWSRGGSEPRRTGVQLGAVTLVLCVVYAAGAWRLAGIRASPGERVLRVGLVQPAIDPATHWDPAQRLAVIETEESLSLPLATSGADVVIWPEASAPFVFAEESFYDIDPDFFAEERKLRRRMLEFAQNLGVPLVFGAPAITSGTVGRGQVWNAVNRAFLLSPRGSIEAHYDKMILVPFGEYVPLPRILFFVDKLIPGMGTFLPGTDFTVFEAPKGRFAVFICYEAIFGDFVRRLAARDTDVLVNITNDAWFGDTSGPYQHFAMAVVRAVENRKPLVRVANTGISAVVDVDGRIRKELPLSQRAAENVEIRWTERSTFYTRFGDVFARLAALAALLMLLYAIVVGRTAKVSAAGLAERE